jgi:2-iminobutanoate/2-iminopropanoate deaminase
MEKEIISTSYAPAAVGPYSQAIKVGNILYLSGQLGLDPDTGTLLEGLEAQTHRSMKNIEAVLKTVDANFNNIVKTTIFITDINDFTKVNEIYASYFDTDPPARSCVEVSALPKGGLVEIESIAVV